MRDLEAHQDRGKEDRSFQIDQKSRKDSQGQMAAAYPKQDRTGDDRDRKHQWRGGGTGLTTCFVDPTDNCVVAVGLTPKGEKGVAKNIVETW